MLARLALSSSSINRCDLVGCEIPRSPLDVVRGEGRSRFRKVSGCLWAEYRLENLSGDGLGTHTECFEVIQSDCSVALGKPVARRSVGQRHVSVGAVGEPERPPNRDLRWRRGEEIVASDDFLDALVGIVGHHREVVRRCSVVASQNDVVDQRARRSRYAIVEADRVVIASESDRGWTSGAAMVGMLG